MTAPDPNGCKRCGKIDCERLAFVGKTVVLCDPQRIRADLRCESRPAVDWQAECRRLAAPAWRREPPTVEEVESGAHWWWMRTGAYVRVVRAWTFDSAFYADTTHVDTNEGDPQAISGEWAPCLPPTGKDVSK